MLRVWVWVRVTVTVRARVRVRVSEVWVIGKGEMNDLEGKVVYLMHEGGGREGEERKRRRENVESAVEGDAWHRIGGKDDTKKKIAVGCSQCEKRAG